MKEKTKWEYLGSNQILEAKWGHVSYNPDTTLGHSFLTPFSNLLGGNVKDGEETALFNKKKDEWLILTGDFRKEYTKAFPCLKKCLEVYQKNIKHRNNWSTD